MKIFKRKSFYAAVVAALGAMGAMDTASAVNINSNGLGQVLIYPYYTVRGGLTTMLSVVNTTITAKAVKVRFTEGKNSREVLDFNLYLSPRDVWTAAVVESTNGGAKLVTADKSCTYPAIPAAGANFVNYAYSGTVIEGINIDKNGGDYEDQSLDRTREGYFEIIEMGVITNATNASAVTHVSGTPRSCATVQTQSMDMSVAGGTNAVAPAAGGLAGGASLINVADGTDFSFEATALASFSNTNLWAPAGSIYPNLRQANPRRSVVFKNGAAITSNWTYGEDAVGAILMHDTLINEFVLDKATDSGTDWVVTMPTKRYDVPVGSGDIFAPFTTRFNTGGACEPVALRYWDREERETSSGVDFSPLPTIQGNALCWESTVVTFNSSNVLGSKNNANIPVIYENGWLQLSFVDAKQRMTSIDVPGHTYVGLPTVGFMVQDFINKNAAPGVMATYGGGAAHRATTLINGSYAD